MLKYLITGGKNMKKQSKETFSSKYFALLKIMGLTHDYMYKNWNISGSMVYIEPKNMTDDDIALLYAFLKTFPFESKPQYVFASGIRNDILMPIEKEYNKRKKESEKVRKRHEQFAKVKF